MKNKRKLTDEKIKQFRNQQRRAEQAARDFRWSDARMSSKDAVTLEKNLAADILMMICGTLDKWEAESGIGGSKEQQEEMVASAKLMSDGIAHKLTQAIAANGSRRLSKEEWQKMVDGATRHAIVEIPDGPIVRAGKNPSFVAAVASCTGWVVDWGIPNDCWSRI